MWSPYGISQYFGEIQVLSPFDRWEKQGYTPHLGSANIRFEHNDCPNPDPLPFITIVLAERLTVRA